MAQLSKYAQRRLQRRTGRTHRCEHCGKVGATLCLRDTFKTTWLHAHCQSAWVTDK